VGSALGVWQVCCAALNGEDGWIAVLKAYMDESGTHDGSPVVTVGLYAGVPINWRRWTKDWNRQKRPIKVFHAVDAHNRTGEFEGWSRPARNEYCAKLLPVIATHNILGVTVGIRMHQFEVAMKSHPELRKMFGTPYVACFQWTVQTFLEMMDESGIDKRVAFFHELNDYRDEAEAAFAYIKKQAWLRKKPITLTFGGKDDFIPLQAADVLAYEANHKLRDPSKPTRPSWEAINPGADTDEKESRIRLLHYGKTNMLELVRLLTDFRAKLLAQGWDGKVEK
jgi:hypothetical protein